MHFLRWTAAPSLYLRLPVSAQEGERYQSRREGCVAHQIKIASGSAESPAEHSQEYSTELPSERLTDQTCVQKLAQLFPQVSALRLPVRVITMGTGKKRLEERTVIEFGTAHEVLFGSSLPLEFEDRVRIVNSDGSLDAKATVVAVRYHCGRKAVAARFVGTVQNWIIHP